MTPEAMRSAWRNDGFFYMRGMVEPELVRRIEAEVIAAIRSDPPEKHPDRDRLSLRQGLLHLSGEAAERDGGQPRGPHRQGVQLPRVRRDARRRTRRDIADIVAQLLGEPDIDCFQSQFIFKNPGVIGQPWHQDSYYFRFDRQPQVGVWLALSEATLENGCLWVVPGLAREARDLRAHPRPAAGGQPRLPGDRHPGRRRARCRR